MKNFKKTLSLSIAVLTLFLSVLAAPAICEKIVTANADNDKTIELNVPSDTLDYQSCRRVLSGEKDPPM